jgi:hypothetical protein
MENELLIARIEAYTQVWEENERMAPGSCEQLMENNDFWDSFLHSEFQQRRGWHKLGNA